jgi:hypothetical protein
MNLVRTEVNKLGFSCIRRRQPEMDSQYEEDAVLRKIGEDVRFRCGFSTQTGFRRGVSVTLLDKYEVSVSAFETLRRGGGNVSPLCSAELRRDRGGGGQD